MSRDQRVADNHALVAAQKCALEQNVPLVVTFFVYEKSGYRAREHYEFMIDGLRQVESTLKELSIIFNFYIVKNKNAIVSHISLLDPSAVYFDFSPLKYAQSLQNKIATESQIPVLTVDTHNVVPVWVTSSKQEYAARTIRTKITKLLSEWIREPDQVTKHPFLYTGEISSISNQESSLKALLSRLPSNGQKLQFISGEKAAKKQLKIFITSKLATYDEDRNDPVKDGQSDLSPYLHFGQLSSLRVAIEVTTSEVNNPDAFLEELIVRKELSDNYCFYNQSYNSLEGASDWARKTLAQHAGDPREFIYSFEQLEQAQTHDPSWNAAQNQLVRTGKIHGYMRMYWAKKVLEWSESAEQAIDFLIRLNDFYSIDGGDPNGYVGILWSVAGLHDRPWFEREVYGTIRYMNAAGLKRKFKIDEYILRYS